MGTIMNLSRPRVIQRQDSLEEAVQRKLEHGSRTGVSEATLAKLVERVQSGRGSVCEALDKLKGVHTPAARKMRDAIMSATAPKLFANIEKNLRNIELQRQHLLQTGKTKASFTPVSDKPPIQARLTPAARPRPEASRPAPPAEPPRDQPAASAGKDETDAPQATSAFQAELRQAIGWRQEACSTAAEETAQPATPPPQARPTAHAAAQRPHSAPAPVNGDLLAELKAAQAARGLLAE